MNDLVEVALIAAAPAFLTSLVGVIISVLNFFRGRTVAKKLEAVHDQINGQQALLLQTARGEASAIGEAVGREKALSERADRVAESERVEDRVDKREEVRRS